MRQYREDMRFLIKSGSYCGYLEGKTIYVYASEEHEALSDRYGWVYSDTPRGQRPRRTDRKANCRLRLKGVAYPEAIIEEWRAKLSPPLLSDKALNEGTLTPFPELDRASEFFQRFGIEVTHELPNQ